MLKRFAGLGQTMLKFAIRSIAGAPGPEKIVEESSLWALNIVMTALLEKAMSRVSDLPAKRQNEIARLVLAEMDAEATWDESFKTSQPELAEMAAAALAESRSGKTRKMDLANDF